MSLIKVLLTVLFISLYTYGLSQHITNVDYKIDGNNIIVTYDLEAESRTNYKIDLVFLSREGNQLIPKTVEGDIGIVKGGKNKKIIWAVTEDVQSLEGDYKVILTIIDKIKNHHALFYSVNVALTFAGIRYAYLGKFGGYTSLSTDFGIIDTYSMFTAGFTFRVAEKYYPYIGGGIEISFDSATIIEAGSMINFGKLAFDIGIGAEFYSTVSEESENYYSTNLNAMPFVKIGLGFCF